MSSIARRVTGLARARKAGVCMTKRNRFGTTSAGTSTYAAGLAIATATADNSPNYCAAHRKGFLSFGAANTFTCTDVGLQGDLDDLLIECRDNGKLARPRWEWGSGGQPVGRPSTTPVWVSGTTYAINAAAKGPTSLKVYECSQPGAGTATTEPTHTTGTATGADGYYWSVVPDYWVTDATYPVGVMRIFSADSNLGNFEQFVAWPGDANLLGHWVPQILDLQNAYWTAPLGAGAARKTYLGHLSTAIVPTGEDELKDGYGDNMLGQWLGVTAVTAVSGGPTRAQLSVAVLSNGTGTTTLKVNVPTNLDTAWPNLASSSDMALVALGTATPTQALPGKERVLICGPRTTNSTGAGYTEYWYPIVNTASINPYETYTTPGIKTGRAWYGTYLNNTHLSGWAIGNFATIMCGYNASGTKTRQGATLADYDAASFFEITFNGVQAVYEIPQVNRRARYDYGVNNAGFTPDTSNATAIGSTGVEAQMKDSELAAFKTVIGLMMTHLDSTIVVSLPIDALLKDFTYVYNGGSNTASGKQPLVDWIVANCPRGRFIPEIHHLIPEANISSDGGGAFSANDTTMMTALTAAGFNIAYQFDGSLSNGRGTSTDGSKGVEGAVENVITRYGRNVLSIEGPASRFTSTGQTFTPYQGLVTSGITAQFVYLMDAQTRMSAL